MTTWLPTLKTATPQEGYELALTLARKAVGLTQPDPAVREKLRPVYALRDCGCGERLLEG
jgi:hypothetical protein